MTIAALFALAAACAGANPAPEKPTSSSSIMAKPAPANPVIVDGEKTQWQRMRLTFSGPQLDETPATFRNYRFDIIFTHIGTGAQKTIPGYFAADGKAAYSSADRGSKWRAIFVPDRPGRWQWRASFRSGSDVAVADSHEAGSSAGHFDGLQGEIAIETAQSTGSGPAFSDHGLIVHFDSHYARHAFTGKLFLKTGTGSPENIFAYSGFDGTYDHGGTNFPALGENQLHDFASHLKDWKAGDPDWGDDRSKGLIGAINYLSDVGVNAQYMVMMNVEGDGQDVWPWTGPENFYSFDVSKLEQWQIAMNHMDDKGIVKDILFTETENESLLEAKEGADFFSVARKLYYREMIARFGHNLGLTWNLGEEMGVIGNTGSSPWRDPTTPQQQKAFVDYIAHLDAYDHPIVMHNWPDGEEALYGPFLGHKNYSGISLQAHEDYEERITGWREKSAKAGRKWLIAVDEALGWEFGARPDSASQDHDVERMTVLWPTLLSGAAGIDWYFGWQNNAPTSDLSNENMRSRHNLWVQSRIARELLTRFPLDQMEPRQDHGTGGITHVLARAGESYVAYMPKGEAGAIDLRDLDGQGWLEWYNPKTGAKLGAREVTGGAKLSLSAPADDGATNTDRLLTISKMKQLPAGP